MTGPPIHPLDGRDEWECYDLHISERNKLIEGKRQAEDAFIKTVVQLSSGIALIVPGFLSATGGAAAKPSCGIIIGLGAIVIALIAGLSEQFLSSLAYGKQIEKTDSYYNKQTSDVSPPALSIAVQTSMVIAFLSFTVGVVLISWMLLSSHGV